MVFAVQITPNYSKFRTKFCFLKIDRVFKSCFVKRLCEGHAPGFREGERCAAWLVHALALPGGPEFWVAGGSRCGDERLWQAHYAYPGGAAARMRWFALRGDVWLANLGQGSTRSKRLLTAGRAIVRRIREPWVRSS